MTTIGERRDQAAERVRHLKEAKVADWTGEDRPELHPTVIGWRGDEEVVVLMAAQVDRDEGLRAAQVAAMGFGCDSLAFCVDTWGTKLRVNPMTGREWGEREMQGLVERHQGIERGWINEALSTFVVNRAGDLAASYQGYRQTRVGFGKRTRRWTLEWTDSHTSEPGEVGHRHEGRVPDALHRAMTRPTSMQYLASLGLTGRDFGLDDVEAMAHADCGAVRAAKLGGWAGAILLTAEDPRRQKIVEESLGHMRMDL